MTPIESRNGRITYNPLQAPEPDEVLEPDGPVTTTTDPWGITDIPGLNGTPAPAVEDDEDEGGDDGD